MTITRRLVSVLFLVCLCSRYSNAQSLSMGDDGYGTVNLNFSFPYYDKTFNQAYMYDNGVLSFLQPGTPNALSPWQWYSQPLSQTQAKYFIAPLWADIAPVSQTQYLVDNQLTSAKFTWNNIAEYYSRGGILRLNSFSVEINANGDIATKYFGLNLRTSNISVGFKGDTDYTQIAYNPYGYVLSSQADWTANTKITAVAPTPTPVKQEPLPEPILAPATTEQVVQQSEPVQTVTTTVVAPVASVAPTVTATAPTAVQAPVVVTETKTETKKQAAKSSGVDSGTSVAEAAVALALSSASQSVNEQQTTNLNVTTSNNALSLFNKPTDSNQSMQLQNNSNSELTQTAGSITERKDTIDTVLLDSLVKPEYKPDGKDKGINKGVVANTGLGVEVPLFTTYAAILPDAVFYIPKEIYKKQRVVDNQRLLRSLVNDEKYTRMIDGQYR